jgi:GDPmannose 4,6-dehydratase
MSRNKVAFVTGASGQDGSYLCELLLSKGYEVHTLQRWHSSPGTQRIDHIKDQLHLHVGDLGYSLDELLRAIRPDEVYNLGAMSHVRVSFEIPEYTSNVTGVGVLRLLESIRRAGINPRIYQASSSEMFGSSPPPQNENTPFHPRSPYGCSKVFAFHVIVNYRESYMMHASNGILFNHESPRRGESFVTRKITKYIGDYLNRGERNPLFLGNLDAKRDWGFAGDYVEAMWLMMQQPDPDDYVIATGEMHTVREFAELAFKHAGLDWQSHVRFDPHLLRPAEVDALQGDSTKARQILGWRPKTSFQQLVNMMVDADLK